MIAIFEIPGITAWKRARVSRSGRFIDVQKDEKQAIAWHLRKQWGTMNYPVMRGPLSFLAVFQKRRPKNVPAWEINCAVRPDVDNLTKFILDAAMTVDLIEDDGRVFHSSAFKIWGDDDRTLGIFLHGDDIANFFIRPTALVVGGRTGRSFTVAFSARGYSVHERRETPAG